VEPTPEANALTGWRVASRSSDAPPFKTLLRQLRERANLKQRDLAGLTKLDPTFISRLESGERNASRDNVEALADALSASPRERLDLLVAADVMISLDPLLEDLLVLWWSEALPSSVRAQLKTVIEVAVSYGNRALEGDE
jgi:transcriptional regulator with XRE-family HTH domain